MAGERSIASRERSEPLAGGKKTLRQPLWRPSGEAVIRKTLVRVPAAP